jgi:hypothetical protein
MLRCCNFILMQKTRHKKLAKDRYIRTYRFY